MPHCHTAYSFLSLQKIEDFFYIIFFFFLFDNQQDTKGTIRVQKKLDL